MIIKEEQDTIIFIEQHEHARISGQFAHKWQVPLFLGREWRTSVEYAVTNHDRSWIPLDRKIMYLKDEKVPASFTDYSLKKKISAYKTGIDQLVNEDSYAGYLLSCHYASFFKGKSILEGQLFVNKEEERQERLLRQGFSIEKELTSEMRNFHFDLLQFCDNLSLYLCMNHWGIDKEGEISWFKQGFPQKMATLKDRQLYSTWESESSVKLNPFPFTSEQLHISIPYKRLDKQQVMKRTGIQEIYRETPYSYHPVVMTN